MRLSVSEAARDHMARIHDHIAGDNPYAARRVLADLRRAMRILKGQPHIGHAGQLTGTREWPVRGRPYIIVYRVDEAAGEVVVVGLYHAARLRPPD
ncbi:type II toxin-antitoxin system RelE/ParE family toxin [Ancylobacter terrae]|uniref:type II toxin-antitoxin system RelE/ParE family toxin n=1 Tax=Ancylobacter sp. sgz301288 TaxID=3342077 RepID=UPI00385A9B81